VVAGRLSSPGPVHLHIRAATVADAGAISRLIGTVAHHFTLHPQGEGAEAFLQTLSPEAIAGCVQADAMAYNTAWGGDALAGVLALRDRSHVFHLFVAAAYQRQGVAQALWRHAMSEARAMGHNGGFTVNATPYALPVYERFGFVATGPEVQTRGIAYVPMQLEGDDSV
jgi:GNAT superfamily N-acetyltransferase